MKCTGSYHALDHIMHWIMSSDMESSGTPSHSIIYRILPSKTPLAKELCIHGSAENDFYGII